MAFDFSMPILIVADYRTTAGIVTNLLKQIGFEHIDVASSGAAALAKLRAKSYGLIVADWSLEPMTGGELLAEIRAEPRFAEIPVLMLAPQSQASRVVAAMAGGRDGYILKPFNAPALRRRIQAILAAPHYLGDAHFTRQAGASLPSA